MGWPLRISIALGIKKGHPRGDAVSVEGYPGGCANRGDLGNWEEDWRALVSSEGSVLKPEVGTRACW